MSIDITDLRPTIVPKSDQLNAEQLLGGAMVITVTDVRAGSGDDQPVSIHYENDAGRPFKPCKTMRKVLVLAWGHDATQWIGKSMTLYNDPSVKFGGMEVGGIRISHLTDIPKDIRVNLTTTKGKKAPHIIGWMPRPGDDAIAKINAAGTVDELKEAFGAAYKGTKDPAQRASLKAAYDARMVALTKQTKTLAQYKEDIDNAGDAEIAALVLDEAADNLGPAELDELRQAYAMAWTKVTTTEVGAPLERRVGRLVPQRASDCSLTPKKIHYSFRCYSCANGWERPEATADCPRCGTTNNYCAADAA